MKKYRFVYEHGMFDGLSALSMVIDVLRAMGSSPAFSLRGNDVGLKAIERETAERKAWPSGLASSGYDLRFGLIPAWGQCFVLMQETVEHDHVDLGSKFDPLLGVRGMVQAWVADVDYDYWQNATDPLQYEHAGRTLSGLSLKSNGLPPPLHQMEIDTSLNPGRKVFRQGYMEAVGSLMWLGDSFWSKVGTSRGRSLSMLKEAGVKVYESGNADRIVASDAVFRDESTSKTQKLLRSALFGVD